MQVVVDSKPPDVKIIHPTEGQVYTMEDDELVSITADARDTWVERVEVDGDEWYVAYHRPEHRTLRPAAPSAERNELDHVPAVLLSNFTFRMTSLERFGSRSKVQYPA